MTHTYNITGMTCNGCVAKVKSELLKDGDIQSANVQLASPQATITMGRHIPLAVLQQEIGPKYIITDAGGMMQQNSNEMTAESTSYYPILLIFGYIAGITTLVQLAKGPFSITGWMNGFMAGFFLLFSFFKLLNLSAFADGYGTYDIIAKRVRGYGYVYPFIELLLGVAYLINFQPFATNVVTLAVMGISTTGVIQSLLKKSNIQCACLGTIIKLPLSKVTLLEDLLMAAMSAAMLINLY